MHLVIADDDGDSADVLAQLLRLSVPGPLTVAIARDGKQAVAAATDARVPDAVIMDLEMPEMNGFDAAAAIKSALGNRAPVIVAVSGHLDRVELARTSSAFSHAFPKPIVVGELIRLLLALRSA